MECAIGLPRPLLGLFFLNWKLEKIWTVTSGVKGWRPMFFGWSGVGVAAVEVLLLIVGDGFDEKSAHIALNLLGE